MTNLWKSLLTLAFVFLVGVHIHTTRAASVTAIFPYDLNNFAEDEVIEEEDWNAIEAEIGVRSTSTSTPGSINWILRNGYFTRADIKIGGTSTTTIAGNGGLSTFSGGVISNASSSIANLFADNATTTRATTTVFAVTGHTGLNTLIVTGNATFSAGTINGIVIGGTSPAAGNFTTLSNTGLLSLYGGLTSSSTAITFSTPAVIDAGGAASFEIPNGTGPTVDATGEIAVDTTSDQFVYYGASTKRVVPAFQFPAFEYATSTTWTGTTTRRLGTATVAETWNYAECYTSAGTVNVSFYDGTNRMDLVPASSTPAKYALSTNNTFTAREKRIIDLGTPASSPTAVSCTITKFITAD